MRVLQLSEVEPRARRVAVGEFDGVHIGHRAVIAGNDTVLTFEPHPASVVRPGGGPKLLTDLELKAELIAELGVDELVIVPFDDTFAHRGPSEFAERVLVEGLGATHVSVGANFLFGHGARGTAALLEADSRFQARVVPLVEVDGERVSSTRIRTLIAAGEIENAIRLLGAPFKMRGEVIRGDGRGGALGFPTSNMIPDPGFACPGYGVYACRVGDLLAAVNVGVQPTFGASRPPLVEVFLLDFTGDLHGESLTVEFIARLRDEQRFDSVDLLVEQMHRDVDRTREVLASRVG